MSNTLLNASIITKEALRLLKNNLVFGRGVNRQYDDQFANNGQGKIGATINIRKPVRYTVTDGAPLNLQNQTDQSVALVLDKQKHVGFQFSSKEMALNIEEFSPRYIEPAIAALANKIDFDLAGLYSSVWNSVGIPGTTPATALVALQAGQKLKENGCPVDGNLSLVFGPAAEAAMVNGLSSIFNMSAELKGQYEKGMMGRSLGFTWKMDQNIQSRTTGESHGLTVLVDTTTAADGDTTLVTDGWGSALTNAVKAGDVFTMVHVVGYLLILPTASANSDSVGTGHVTITFVPAFQSTGQYQNIDSLPVDEAAITVVERVADDGTVSPQNMAFHKDAFCLGMADLPLPEGVAFAARASDEDSGLSVRIVRAYDINNDTFPCRVDVLYGVKAIYPELACRIQG